MTELNAIKETAKHFAANLVAGMLHGLIGFGAALILGATVPVPIDIVTLKDLMWYSVTVGSGAGVLGAVLAVQAEAENKFKAGRVIKFVREVFYPAETENGGQYILSSSCSLSVKSRKTWLDYVLYY